MGLSILSILGFGGFQSLSGNLPIGSITAIIEYTVFEPLVFDHGSNGDRHDPKRIDILAAD